MKSVLLNTTVIGSKVNLPRHPRLIIGGSGSYIDGDILDANAVTAEIRKVASDGNAQTADILLRLELAEATLSSAIDTRINELIGAAPEALDTLKEIADSLNNEPNLATSLLSQITALDNKIDNINTNQTNALNAAVTDIEAALARKADLELISWNE